MDQQLNTPEHAQQTATDRAIRFGARLVVALRILAVGTFRERGIQVPFPQREVRLPGAA